MTTSAEFNFYSDPEAAYVVLNQLKSPITIVTWETCEKYSLPWVNITSICLCLYTVLQGGQLMSPSWEFSLEIGSLEFEPCNDRLFSIAIKWQQYVT